jgi:hypothetical protein
VENRYRRNRIRETGYGIQDTGGHRKIGTFGVSELGVKCRRNRNGREVWKINCYRKITIDNGAMSITVVRRWSIAVARNTVFAW